MRRASASALCALLCALLLSCADEKPAKETVMVSIPPLRTLVAGLLDSAVDVRTLVPSGASPEQFEPSPEDIRALSRAKLLFAIGENFESAWLGRVQRQLTSLRVENLGEGLATLRFEDEDEDDEHEHHHDDGEHEEHEGLEHHHDDGEHEEHEEHAHEHDGHHHHHAGADPHIWTDPANLAELSRRAATVLAQVYPERADSVSARLNRRLAELERLDSVLAETLAPARGKAILVFHPAWGYLCNRYGLRQIAIEHAGHSPSPRALAGIIDRAKRERAAAIFVAAQTDKRVAASIAEQLGIPVVEIDPIALDFRSSLTATAKAFAGSAAPEDLSE